jgi:Domain of unknown function (DUF4402)
MSRFTLTECLFKKLFLAATASFCYAAIFAQPDIPQQSTTVAAAQAICFGKFCVTGSGGGTITVAYDGTRTCTGGIILLPGYPTAEPAIFEAKLCPNKTVSINFDATTNVSAAKGALLKMDIGPTEKGLNGAVFTTNTDCNSTTALRVGGTLYISGKTMSGNYSGIFNITFKQE